MNRTFLFGIDGATFTILAPLINEGLMPRFKSLLTGGAHAELLSTPHPLTPPAWTTVMTGQTPGNHGIFDFIWSKQRNGTYFFTLNNFTDICAETVWSMVSRMGGRVTVLNFPFLSPPPDLQGTIVPGLVSWKHLRRNCHPPDVFERLRTIPGFDVKKAAWDFEQEKQATRSLPDEHHGQWVIHHIEREKQWMSICRHTLEREPADLTAILLDGVDKIQHICWRYLDLDYPIDDPTDQELRVRALCIEYFQLLDRFLGEVLDLVGPNARLFVVSDHGFGPTQKVFRVNRWLAENGYLAWPSSDHWDENERAKREKLVTGHFVHLDWQNTRACVQSAATNGIYIVRADQGQAGVLEEEYPAFCDRLIAQLLAIRDPDGEQIVTQVLRKEEAFPGAHNERCPDLTLILHDYGFVSTLETEPTFFSRPEVAGTHRPEGVFLATGPGIRANHQAPQQSIVDIAPTLLYSLGLDVPTDLDGRVMVDAFEETFLADHPVQYRGTTQLGDVGEASALDEDDQAAIVERLRALGYME